MYILSGFNDELQVIRTESQKMVIGFPSGVHYLH